MKKKSFIVIVILLIAIILGLCSYIAYDKNLFGIKGEKKESNTVEKKEDTNTTKELDINSELVKNLVYPKSNSEMYSSIQNVDIMDDLYPQTTYSNFVLKEDYASSYDIWKKIAASLEKYIGDKVDCYYYGHSFSLTPADNLGKGICKRTSEEIINRDMQKVFGPDSDYNIDNSSETYCGYPLFYDSETKSYYGPQACGGAYFVSFKPILKTYKAELIGDYLYVYDYALINYITSSVDNGTISLLFDSYDAYQKYENTKSTESAIASVASEKEAQSKLEELINSGKANTYIWTFKKQSDGKYYYYSSKWQ